MGSVPYASEALMDVCLHDFEQIVIRSRIVASEVLLHCLVTLVSFRRREGVGTVQTVFRAHV